uniref:Uncharacterized protein n=1 Tax=Anguilla anguilla TaxID=7936 RepID=A0A0E9QW03_ANGAN
MISTLCMSQYLFSLIRYISQK